MRLLDLPASVQQQVMEQKISMGHARALIGVPDCETLARRVEEKGLSVRDTEQLVRRMKTGDDTPAARRTGAAAEPDADIASLEQHLADILGLKVDIRHADPALFDPRSVGHAVPTPVGRTDLSGLDAKNRVTPLAFSRPSP